MGVYPTRSVAPPRCGVPHSLEGCHTLCTLAAPRNPPGTEGIPPNDCPHCDQDLLEGKISPGRLSQACSGRRGPHPERPVRHAAFCAASSSPPLFLRVLLPSNRSENLLSFSLSRDASCCRLGTGVSLHELLYHLLQPASFVVVPERWLREAGDLFKIVWLVNIVDPDISRFLILLWLFIFFTQQMFKRILMLTMEKSPFLTLILICPVFFPQVAALNHVLVCAESNEIV